MKNLAAMTIALHNKALLRSPSLGRMVRIAFQQGELFISPSADVSGQGAVITPEIRVRAVDHYAGR